MSEGWTVYRESTKEEAEVIARFGIDPALVAIQDDGERKHLLSRHQLEATLSFINSLVGTV